MKRITEFVDWLLRAKEADLRTKLLPNLFLWRRIHKSNLGLRHRAQVGDYIKILKIHLFYRFNVKWALNCFNALCSL